MHSQYTPIPCITQIFVTRVTVSREIPISDSNNTKFPLLMPYPCSQFYFDIKLSDNSQKRKVEPGLFSFTKIDIKVKVTTWIGH